MKKQETDLAEQVAIKAARKLKARRNPAPGVWFGLGLMGIVGWAVVVPTLLGAALGLWLDSHYPGGRSWTLRLLHCYCHRRRPIPANSIRSAPHIAWRWLTCRRFSRAT